MTAPVSAALTLLTLPLRYLRCLVVGLAMLWWPTPAAAQSPPPTTQWQAAGSAAPSPSAATETVLQWVVGSNDNTGLPFVIIDKVDARVYVYNQAGTFQGASYALLGAARGDDSAPGIGSQTLSSITPSERTTPAGRFVAVLGRDLEHDVLWIDYDQALALHRVVHGDPTDHRLERLAINSSKDKRISYGCVNVPSGFFDDVILPSFRGTKGIVYILPEVKTLKQIFPTISTR